MSTGYQQAHMPPPHEGGAVDTVPPFEETHETEVEPGFEQWLAAEDENEQRPRRPMVVGAIIIILALAWLGAWAVFASPPALTAEAMLRWLATVSPPLVLLGIAWIILGQSPRKETQRFQRAVVELRSETAALETMLAIVARRLEENHTRLTSETTTLMTLGEEAADRLGRVTHFLSKESKTLGQQSEALEAAAANARVDIGVLLHDLPRAEEQARTVAAAMRETGMEAHSQAGALEGQLAVLTARSREADEAAGGAAQRLGAHLARIESNAASAIERLDEAALGMSAAIDGTMSRAAEAIDTTRSSLDSQAAAMLAAIEQNRSALEQAGEEASRNLGARLEMIGGKVEGLASHLAAQDAASHALMDSLASEIGAVEERFAALRESGLTGAAMLNDSFQTVRTCAQELFRELGSGHERAGGLIERAHEMAQALASIGDQLDTTLPAGLAKVEEQAGRTAAAAAAITPQVESIQGGADAAAARIAEAEASLARQQETLNALLARLDEGVSVAETQLRGLGSAAEDADRTAQRIVGETAPGLVEALLRVRETAAQAAERARAAIGAVIPESAAALAEATREAMTKSVSGSVEAQMADVSNAAERAVEAARQASERLTRQLLTIGETAAAIEKRIEDEHRTREEQEAATLSRRVALLIESLNSTAIDVTKILSNEVTDSAWAAYLKGDRGVFTRRAVRLLDTGEAREVLQLYESEPDFREQVNRYIHDFESMLRRVLADRDGSPLGVTILSSDMGKLYVALAQAIERLRT